MIMSVPAPAPAPGPWCVTVPFRRDGAQRKTWIYDIDKVCGTHWTLEHNSGTSQTNNWKLNERIQWPHLTSNVEDPRYRTITTLIPIMMRIPILLKWSAWADEEDQPMRLRLRMRSKSILKVHGIIDIPYCVHPIFWKSVRVFSSCSYLSRQF